MKIPLHVRQWGSSVSPFIYARIYLPWSRLPLFCWLLVDSGSFETLIGQSDLEKGFLKDRTLKRELLKTPPKKVLIGGGRHDGYPIGGTIIRLNTEDNNNMDIFPSNAHGLYSANQRETAQIPSILGTECMSTNKLALYFSPHKKEAYLIQEE